MILFTAFCSAQNLAGQMYTQLGYGNLGQVCLFVVFGFLSISSPIAAHYKQKIPIKSGLIFGAITYVGFIFAGLFTSFCAREDVEGSLCHPSIIYGLNIVCSAMVGIGGAFIWLFQGTYVNDCADEKTKGLYNGLFWSIFQSSQVLSSLLATIILGMTDQFTFYSILMMFALASVVMFFFVLDPVKYTNDTNTVGNSNQSFGEAMSKFYECLRDRNCHFFFVGLVFSGLAIGSYIAFLGTIVRTTIQSDNQNVINQSIGYVLLVLAFGEVAAGLSMGKLADKFEKLKLFNVTIVINEAALAFTVLACLFKSYPCALIGGLLYGYGDTGIQTMISAVIGSVFNGRMELFSAYRFFQCFGIMFSCVTAVFIPEELPIIYLMIIAATLLVAHTMFSKLLPSKNKAQEYLLAEEKRIMIELRDI